MSSVNLKDSGGAQGSQTKVPSNRCSICNNELPLGGHFCKYCDPPLAPELTPESIWGFGQTFFLILILIILFLGLILYKMDIPLGKIWQSEPTDQDATQIKDRLTDPDFKIIHFVNVHMANVRLKPSTLEGKIIMVLNKDDGVTILQRHEKWSQISAKGKTGWIRNSLLDFKVK